MKEVSQAEYWDKIKNLDAVYSCTQTSPHVEGEWTLRGSREVIAKSVDDEHGLETKYFIK